MFRSHGPGPSHRQHRLVAGYLALVGGYVNSAGFVLIGSFTSHVTGNVGRLANDLATGQLGAAATALMMVSAFMAGAFLASTIIESGLFARTATAYAAALYSEATLLVLFMAAADLVPAAHPRLLDVEAAVLCSAMGMQNSLVTRLSGAVVRTTHLTGVVTDIGIEGARWLRWWRSSLSDALRMRLSVGRHPAEKPSEIKLALLVTIAGGFAVGAVIGAVLAVRLRQTCMVPPSVAVAACGAYALITGRANREPVLPEARP